MPLQKFKQILRYLKWFFPYRRSIKDHNVNVLSFKETIDCIVRERLSVSRFGDGELRFMLSSDSGDTFEVNSKKLADSLKVVLTSKSAKMLVCLPDVFNGVKGLNLKDQVFWQREVSIYLRKYVSLLDENYLYGDSFFTRPYQLYSEQSIKTAYRFKQLKRIWDDRNILLVEGNLTRFGYGNDLLDNAKSVERILVPAKNAFEKVDNIYLSIKRYIGHTHKKDLLILISAGPTATILAYMISKELEIQAVDIGHLDIEYEWFEIGAESKVAIRGKYVNEAVGEKYLSGDVSSEYNNEVVDRIK